MYLSDPNSVTADHTKMNRIYEYINIYLKLVNQLRMTVRKFRSLFQQCSLISSPISHGQKKCTEVLKLQHHCHLSGQIFYFKEDIWRIFYGYLSTPQYIVLCVLWQRFFAGGVAVQYLYHPPLDRTPSTT